MLNSCVGPLHGATEYIYWVSKVVPNTVQKIILKILRFKSEQRWSNTFSVIQHFEDGSPVITCGLQLTKQIIWLNLYAYVDIVNTILTEP